MPKISKKAIRNVRNDANQYVLAPSSTVAISDRKHATTTFEEYKPTIYYCPFCLYYGMMKDFQFLTAKHKTSKKARCPDCKNEFLMRSLTSPMSAEQYAEWVFMYSADGYWKKCKWDIWKDRLYKLGMAQKFWDKYRLLKGAIAGQETYAEHIMREQEDWAKERGYV